MVRALAYQVRGKPLTCLVCGHDRWMLSYTLLNTAGATFFNVEWANKQAQTLTCDACSHIIRFRDESAAEAVDE